MLKHTLKKVIYKTFAIKALDYVIKRCGSGNETQKSPIKSYHYALNTCTRGSINITKIAFVF